MQSHPNYHFKYRDSWNYNANFEILLLLLIHFSHSLLDQKINNVLSISNDQVVLMSIQSIIQNMLATEDSSAQQLHFLQSCGFGGLWRFAGPFTKSSVCGLIIADVVFISKTQTNKLNYCN